MTSVSDHKVFDDLDHALQKVNLHLEKVDTKGLDLCGTYKSIRPSIVAAIKFINGVPGWLKPGWVNSIVTALQTLISLLDKICP